MPDGLGLLASGHGLAAPVPHQPPQYVMNNKKLTKLRWSNNNFSIFSHCPCQQKCLLSLKGRGWCSSFSDLMEAASLADESLFPSQIREKEKKRPTSTRAGLTFFSEIGKELKKCYRIELAAAATTTAAMPTPTTPTTRTWWPD